MSTPFADHEVQAAKPETNRTYRKPLYDVRPLGDSYEIRVVMPGVSKQGANVSLNGPKLEIVGKRESTPPEDWRPVLTELNWNDYRLNLELNVPVDEAAIKANVEDGVLHLTLPKPEDQKPRTIEIQ